MILTLASAGPAPAQTASLVRDLNTADRSPFSASGFLIVKDKVFFLFDSVLWVTDGAQAGTRMLAEPCHSSNGCFGQAKLLGALGDRVLWIHRDGSLWSSDGTRQGTVRLSDPESGFGVLAWMGTFFDGAFVTSGCTESGCGLWRTDGTVAGTRVTLLSSELFIRRLQAAGTRLFFELNEYNFTRELWVMDAGAEDARRVASFPEFSSREMTALGNRIFFAAHLQPELPFGCCEQPLDIKAVGRRFYFLSDGPEPNNEELWQSDGTPQGTQQVLAVSGNLPRDIRVDSMQALAGDRVLFSAGAGGGILWTAGADPRSAAPLACSGTCPAVSPGTLRTAGARAVFYSRNLDLWGTDGTAAGTVKLQSRCPAGGGCPDPESPLLLSWPQGAAFFGWDSVHGTEVWITDGTPAGTRRLTDLPGRLLPATPFTDGRTVALRLSSPEGDSLWTADAAGTRRIAVLPRNAGSSAPEELRPFGSGLLFSACTGGERQIWKSSGSEESTVPLTSGAPGFTCTQDSFKPHLTVTPGGHLAFFLGAPGVLARDLWRTDGTPQGTFQIAADLVAGESIAALGKKLYFPVRFVPALWRSDGTTAGTVETLRLPGATHPTGLSSVTAAGGLLYLLATNTDARSELWRTDGTAAGLVRLGVFQSIEPKFVAAGSRVFFVANGQIWKTGGTPGTTAVLADAGLGVTFPKDLSVSQGALYFLVEKSYRYWTIWRSDGTTEGTVPLRNVALPENVTTLQLTAAAGKTFFAAAADNHDQELWVTDGTAAGTRIVREISPGLPSSSPTELTAAGDLLMFSAADGTHGFELWQSDGTEEGTHLVQDIAPEAPSSSPLHLTAAGESLYFSADDGATGRELWTLPLAGPDLCQPSSTRLCLQGGRYQVEAAWRTAQGARGHGTALPLTGGAGETGAFWFFSPSNVEIIVKVLDGRDLNGHTWVFYGALSDVEYTITVTDTRTGLTRRYFNPQGQLASVGDTHGFGPLGAYSTSPLPPVATVATGEPSALPLVSKRIGRAAAVPCQASAQRLCLNNNRFAVEVNWKDFQNRTGIGTAMALTGDTGTFWFFDAANVELVVKVLDGRAFNGKFWLFYGALSNVEYTLTVTDTQTGTTRTYTNPSGRFASVGDTEAF